MGKVVESITPELREWIERQHVFFVATAPAGPDGHVNLSPKGHDTFRVLDERTVAYLDLTGSGIETVAHLQENGRITILFCAFDGSPRIVRLHGRGEVLRPGHPDHDDLVARFPALPGIRSVIRIACDRVSSSCGYSVPLMRYVGERDTLTKWAKRREPEGIAQYWVERNSQSIDGLPGLLP